MSVYRYFATDVITGALRADKIPLHVSSFSATIGGTQPGTLTGYLDLGALGTVAQAAYISALEPRRTILWVAQDNQPIWSGILWDTPHSSIVSNQLPIRAEELRGLFAHREIRSNQNFASVDQFAIVQALFNYALGKSSGGVANLVIGSGTSGTTASATFSATNLTKVLDAVNQFCAQQNIEYNITPGWAADGVTPQNTLTLGAPRIGRLVTATNLQIVFPSQYVTDYAYPRVGSNSVNSLLVTSSASGQIPFQSGSAHGQNAADFAAGYPLLEGSMSYTAASIGTQAQIDAVADGKLLALSGCTTIPSAIVGGGGTPAANQILLGDQIQFAATSPYHPADPNSHAPGLQVTVRIIGWKIQPPNDSGQSETTQFLFGDITT